MAQTEEQKEQTDLLAQLGREDLQVSGERAEEMKENIVKERGSSNYLGLGVHDVFVQKVELAKANTGSLGIRVTVENPDGQGDATFWLSEKALPYTIENISRLIVHNTADDKKEAARNHMSNVTGAKEIFEIALEKLVGGVGYYTVSESKTQTYTDKKTGEIKPSLERNLTAWKPKEDAQQTAAKSVGGGTPVDQNTKSNIPF